MKPNIMLTTVVLVMLLSGAAYSQGKCNHLTNPTAKRHCLQRQLDEANRQQRLAEERLNRANLRMQKACTAMEALDQAAELAATQHPHVHVKAAGATFYSVRAVTSALTRERRNCESARREVEKTRRRR
jgi:hypothetical protein